jgi:Ran GTPase-activating protein (RanGAP) involved in mRNA processing and transport
MRQNDIHGAEAGKAFSNMLAQNTVLKELDLSSQNVYWHYLDAAFAKELAVGIIDNGTLMSLDISKNNLHVEGTKLLAEALKSNQIMTALNISSNNMTYNGISKTYNDILLTSGLAAIADAIRYEI